MSKSTTVKPNGLCDVIEDVLKKYADDIVTAMPDIVKATARKTVKALKKEASSIGGSVYKNSFKSKKRTSASTAQTTYVIYSTRYRLTHLLEHGHVIRNRPGGPAYGITRAFPHWAPAEQIGIEELESQITQKVEEVT